MLALTWVGAGLVPATASTPIRTDAGADETQYWSGGTNVSHVDLGLKPGTGTYHVVKWPAKGEAGFVRLEASWVWDQSMTRTDYQRLVGTAIIHHPDPCVYPYSNCDTTFFTAAYRDSALSFSPGSLSTGSLGPSSSWLQVWVDESWDRTVTLDMDFHWNPDFMVWTAPDRGSDESETPPSFVYVALGDSYQSGEGAGVSITDTDVYLASAYENGSNYPDQIGPQQNTYWPNVDPDGNSCHRALSNYAKINRDQLEPGADVTLIDVTCSGSLIEPSDRPAIVGVVGTEIAPDSQVQQAIDRLAEIGLTPEDVDLVTVGMGGNDAGFGDIVTECMAPSLLRRVIDAYPNPPGEIEFLVDHVLTCQRADSLIFHGSESIDGLQAKEEWAQAQVLASFPNARVQQLTYPNILPEERNAPATCSGFDRNDIGFARDKVAQINDAIAASVAATGDPNLELVNLDDTFGSNALCPGAGGTMLANSFDDANVAQEIDRLLNVDGTGDALARAKVDSLVTQYRQWKSCVGNKFNPFDGDCDLTQEWADVQNAADGLLDYLNGDKLRIFANLMQPPGTDTEYNTVRYDRSRGLFHPNADGYQIIACETLAAYTGTSAEDCPPVAVLGLDLINGSPLAPTPISTLPGDPLSVTLGGFAPNSPVHITFFSDEVDLGTVMADADGLIEVELEIPDASPGVHQVEFSGIGLGGAQVVKDVKVELPGDPLPGQSYGVYLCCFNADAPDDGVVEYVDVDLLGVSVTEIPDYAGGIFLQVPLPDDTADVPVHAVSRLTGQEATETVEVVNPDALQFGGWGGKVKQAPKWNDAKAGRTVPLKFRVLDAEGRPVRDAEAIDLRTYELQCSTGEDAGEWAAANDAGQSSLRFPGHGWWTFDWWRFDWWKFAGKSPGHSGGAHGKSSSLRYEGHGWWTFDWKTSKDFGDTCRSFSVVVDHGGRTDLWFDFR